MPGARNLAAIMLTDMVGYSALAQRDEGLTLRLLTEHRQIVRQLLPPFGGREVKTMGDGFLVEFDSALNATQCAIEIQRQLAERNREPGRERIELRIALHVGDIIREGSDVLGDTVNIASRLEPLAEPGGILVSGPIFEQVRGKIACPLTQIPTPNLKNLSFPVTAYQIDLPWRTFPTSRVTPWTDREAELRVVREAVDEVRRGEGRLVLIRGEAGIGKTRLADQVLREAERSGFRALHGRAFRGEEGSPYGPWVQAIREFARGAPYAQLARTLGEYVGVLTELVPELGVRAGLGQDTSQLEPAAAQVRMLEVLCQFFFHLSADAPLAVFLDDLQWIDAASQKLLRRLGLELLGHRILLVGAYREADPEEAPGFPKLLLDLRREQPLVPVPLKRLGPTEVDQMLEWSLGRIGLPEDARRFVYERSGGNPFFLEEIIRRLMDDGALFRTNGGWTLRPLGEVRLPENVRTLLQERLARLDPPTLQLLRVASLAGPTFSFDLLRRVVEGVEGELLISVERALQAGVIQERRMESGQVELAFRDSQTQQVLREDVSRVRGRQYHRRIAEALEVTDPEAREHRAGELAHHYLEAAELGKALPYLELAGEQASRVHAYADAARFFLLATEIAEESPEAESRARLLERLGDSTYADGQVVAGRRHWREAAELSRRAGDGRRAGDIYRRLALSFWESEDEESPFREAYKLALELLRSDPSASTELARLYGAAGIALGVWGDPTGAREAAEHALELARRLGLPDVESGAYQALSLVTPLPEKKRALEQAQRAVELAPLSDNSVWFSSNEHLVTLRWWITGDWAEAEKTLAGLIEEARRRHLPIWESHLLGLSGAAAATTGRLSFARERFRASQAISSRLGWPPGAVDLAFLSDLPRIEGDLDGAERDLAEAVRLFEQGAPRHFGFVFCCNGMASICLDRGDPSSALAWLERGLGLLSEKGRTVLTAVPLAHLLEGLVRAQLTIGEVGAAKTRLSELQDLGRQMDEPFLTASVHRAEGQVYAHEGDTDSATRKLTAARAIYEQLGWIYEVGRTSAELGEVFQWAGSVAQARASFDHALGLFREMGAKGDVERVRAQVEALGP